ncbi:MAG: MotA/TolQ/ExbB proton channel family protein [Planctomycetota bacterium]|nr:MotA/TolQ/ExbB proton channel family protein [Planctomycetota bacterium]
MQLPDEVPLAWARHDIEQRLAFRGGRFTRVNTLLSALIGVAIMIAFYAALIPFNESSFGRMFTDQGSIPYTICFFSAWAFSILFLKWRKLRYQKRALKYVVVPEDHDFVLTSATVQTVIDRIYSTVDDPRNFVLFNRIVVALSNLKNLGRVTDVDDILRSQSETDESVVETSYAIVGGFVWAIPVLGFIGTVLGLSTAIGGFGEVLQSTEEFSAIKDALKGVTGGLSTAFVTTLQALVAALFIQLWLTFLKKDEQEFLDECSEYCARHIVNRLRILPFESQPDEPVYE